MAFLEIAFNTGGVQCFCIFFLKQTMAFLGIAFDNGDVQCCCIFHCVARRVFSFNCHCGVWKNVTLCDPNRCRNIEKNSSLHCKMRYSTPHVFRVISWDHMNCQRFQQSRLVTPYNNHEKKIQNTLAKSSDFSSWCFRPFFCPSKWTKIVNVKTCTKSNLSRKRVFQWCSRYMF